MIWVYAIGCIPAFYLIARMDWDYDENPLMVAFGALFLTALWPLLLLAIVLGLPLIGLLFGIHSLMKWIQGNLP